MRRRVRSLRTFSPTGSGCPTPWRSTGAGGENPHCHLVISERSNDGVERTAETWFKRYNGKDPDRGGARKCPTSSKEWLQSTREAWAEHANRALERSGSSERIDHRSLSERAEEAREAELSRVQEELGQMLEDLRGVERAIRKMAKKIADRARRLLDGRQTGQLIRGAFRPSQKPQPERGGGRGELPEKPRDRNMCR